MGLRKTSLSKKLGKKKKSKAAEAALEETSPLHADEEQPATSSSSSSSRLKDKEKRRSERDGKKLSDGKSSSKASSSSSSKDKKRSKGKPKLSREEQDEKDARLGCCHKFAKILVKVIHVIDGLIGLTFVVYGSLILTQFDTPAMEAVVATLTFGSTMLFTSIMGAVGFYTKVCGRFGLLLSAYTAPLIALFYVFVIVALLSEPTAYFDYLTEHKDVLYLNDAEIASLLQILPVFYIILASLTAVEICRFMVLRKIRDALVKRDAAIGRISERSIKDESKRSSKGSSSKRGSKRSSKGSDSGSDRTMLTKPLIDADSSDEESDYEV